MPIATSFLAVLGVPPYRPHAMHGVLTFLRAWSWLPSPPPAHTHIGYTAVYKRAQDYGVAPLHSAVRLMGRPDWAACSVLAGALVTANVSLVAGGADAGAVAHCGRQQGDAACVMGVQQPPLKVSSWGFSTQTPAHPIPILIPYPNTGLHVLVCATASKKCPDAAHVVLVSPVSVLRHAMLCLSHFTGNLDNMHWSQIHVP